jgi:alanine racemase
MGRLGFKPDDLETAVLQLTTLGCEISLMSHFSSADTPDAPQNQAQHAKFSASNVIGVRARSFANSAAILSRPEDHYDVIRPGIMLYGSSPFADQSAVSLGLKPVMRMFATLLDVKTLKVGETVGYGATWQAQEDCTIGIVSIGYADGYPRVVSESAQVVMDGKRFNVVGRVSMDTLAVLLDQDSQFLPGMPVELWGENISIDEVAEWANTIAYELLSKITARVERISV